MIATLNTVALLAAADADAAAAASKDPRDPRAWVWLAYGLVLLLLGVYSAFLLLRTRAVERRLGHLEERLERAAGADRGEG